MKPLTALISLLVAAIPLGGLPMPQESAAKVETLAKQSSFVFSGTVKKTGASNVSVVPPNERTSIVHVDEVLHNDGVVSDVMGNDVTVELASAGVVKEGDKAIFFTNVDTYSDSISVREEGHIGVKPEEMGALHDQVKAALAQVPEEQLQSRIAQADVIVTGSVTGTKPVAGNESRVPASEHDPQWWEATVKVQSVEKGHPPQGDVTVVFPSSKDLRWIGSPKFKEGQQGVFLLHRSVDEKLRVSGFTALSPLDFQAIDQREHVMRLMKAAQ